MSNRGKQDLAQRDRVPPCPQLKSGATAGMSHSGLILSSQEGSSVNHLIQMQRCARVPDVPFVAWGSLLAAHFTRHHSAWESKSDFEAL